MPRKILMLDIECYLDYFLVQFYNPVSGKITFFELTDDLAPQTETKEDREKVRAILRQYRIVTFNGLNYDLPLVFLYLAGDADCAEIKSASDAIIKTGLKYWQIEKKYNITIAHKSMDHVDLIEVSPGKASLKLYGARLHCRKLQDLPIDPDESISPAQRLQLREYCANDLLLTWELYRTLLPQIELREKMSGEYGIDLKSKSDAQIAEAVIGRAISTETGERPQKVEVPPGTIVHYTLPSFVTFSTPVMREACQCICDADYMLSDGGKIIMPPELSHSIYFYGNEYRIGIGGLHSCEESAAHEADDETIIIDRDVQSYYPAIILNCRLYPLHIGSSFFTIYQKLLYERLKAKESGDKVKADALKLVCNGSFGKFGSKYSFLYSPDLLLQTTLTGQLSLLMLIERLEVSGKAHIISANTDGIVITCKKDDRTEVNAVVAAWEQVTGFKTEETQYKALYSRDVNNYIAIKTDDRIKSKGAYTPAGLNKNPVAEIGVDAVIAHLKSGASIEDTVHHCTNFSKFVSARRVTGGAMHEGVYLGKTVRFYYRKGCSTTINYKVNGHLVPKTEGAWPAMELPEVMPQDVDYDWYIREAYSMLGDMGARLW